MFFSWYFESCFLVCYSMFSPYLNLKSILDSNVRRERAEMLICLTLHAFSLAVCYLYVILSWIFQNYLRLCFVSSIEMGTLAVRPFVSEQLSKLPKIPSFIELTWSIISQLLLKLYGWFFVKTYFVYPCFKNWLDSLLPQIMLSKTS